MPDVHSARGTHNKRQKLLCRCTIHTHKTSGTNTTPHPPSPPKPVLPRPRTARLRRLHGSSRASFSARQLPCRPWRHLLFPRSHPSPPPTPPMRTAPPCQPWRRPRSACMGDRRSGKLDARHLALPFPRRRPSSLLRLPRLVGHLAPALRRWRKLRGLSAAGSRAWRQSSSLEVEIGKKGCAVGCGAVARKIYSTTCLVCAIGALRSSELPVFCLRGAVRVDAWTKFKRDRSEDVALWHPEHTRESIASYRKDVYIHSSLIFVSNDGSHPCPGFLRVGC